MTKTFMQGYRNKRKLEVMLYFFAKWHEVLKNLQWLMREGR